jgi:hypothetical protein
MKLYQYPTKYEQKTKKTKQNNNNNKKIKQNKQSRTTNQNNNKNTTSTYFGDMLNAKMLLFAFIHFHCFAYVRVLL